jgi:hypothetical protein
MKVPFTEEAERGIIADLEKLVAEGHCPKKVLLKAVKRSWRGVFGDEDTKAMFGTGAKVEKTPEQLRADAEWYDSKGMRDDAAECRRKAAQREQARAA